MKTDPEQSGGLAMEETTEKIPNGHSNGTTNKGTDLQLEEKQLNAFNQFKQNVADALVPDYPLHQDRELLKFLIARRYDVKKAETMFRQSMQCREKYRVDHILEEFTPPEVLKKYMTGGIGCFDKEGCPVRVEKFGMLDVKGIVYSSKKADLEKLKLFEQERAVKMMQEQSKKLGKRVDKITVIMDLDHVSSKQLWRPGIQMYMHLVKLLEDNYPEFVSRLLVVNAPKIFPLFYKVCRPLISEDMRNKLQVYGTDYTSHLLRIIDEEELPAFLGGKKTGPDGDPKCSDVIHWGGPVPESYYLKDQINMDNMEFANIGAGCKLNMQVEVTKPGCVIQWEFKTDGYDISFGIYRQKDRKKKVEVVPLTRVSSHLVPEDGSVALEDLGTYVVTFDNSFSWARSKKLWYCVEVLEEDDTTAQEVEELEKNKSKDALGSKVKFDTTKNED